MPSVNAVLFKYWGHKPVSPARPAFRFSSAASPIYDIRLSTVCPGPVGHETGRIFFAVISQSDATAGTLAAELLVPVLEIVPRQLLAFHIAARRGCDIDQPCALARSVTVQ